MDFSLACKAKAADKHRSVQIVTFHGHENVIALGRRPLMFVKYWLPFLEPWPHISYGDIEADNSP